MKKILVIVSMILFGGSGAWALGTNANTTITNGAILSYDAGGVSQPDINSSIDTFVVDRKIDMVLVTTDTDQLDVTPDQQDRITNYAFQNEGNADQNFTFSAANLVGGQADYNAEVDNEQVSGIEVQCTYGATTYGWATSVTIDVGEDDNITCQVRADIPAAPTGADGDVMNVRLTAIAVDSAGAAESEDTGADVQGDVDIVFADGETHSTLGGDDASKGDLAGDGQELANSGYVIQTPVLSAEKTSCVVSDPVNGATATAKRIPGAVVRYMIDIENTGTGSVADLNITDALNTNFVDGTDISIDHVFKNENQTSCACASPGSTATVHSESGMTTTLQGISVAAPSGGNESHSCVSFEVEVR